MVAKLDRILELGDGEAREPIVLLVRDSRAPAGNLEGLPPLAALELGKSGGTAALDAAEESLIGGFEVAQGVDESRGIRLGKPGFAVAVQALPLEARKHP